MSINQQGDGASVRYEAITESHLGQVMEIEGEAYPEPWSIGMFREEIRSPRSQFYVMLLGDEIIGYGGFWLVLDEAHITSVTVRDRHRGKGLGKQLLELLLRHAVELGVRIATLEVRASNTRARGLYERFGFRAVGIRKGYYSNGKEDAVVMLKEPVAQVGAVCGEPRAPGTRGVEIGA